MKILLVIPTLQQGGAERVMSELANTWAKNHSVHLVLLAESDDFYSVPDSVVVHRLGFSNRGRLAKIREEFRVMRELRKLVKTESPAFVLSFMEKFNEFTLLSSWGLGVPVYVSDRSNPLKKIGKARKFLKKVTYAQAAGLAAQTQFAKDCLSRSTSNENIEILRNPIREVKLYPENERENLIIGVGRMVKEKGFKYLLESFSKLSGGTWRLVILGDGPLRAELTELAENLGVSDRVSMPGAVGNVDEYLSKASIFAFPSISEGFPNALAEAMIAGLPCVSFDCNAGPRDVIEDQKNGYLVDTHDVEAFSSRLEQLCQSPELRSSIGREAGRIRSKYSASAVAEDWLKFLTDQTDS